MSSRSTLVLGGAASGKSAYAESLFDALTGPLIYIATAQAYDAEMEAKIRIHTDRRGLAWHTVEAPLDAAGALERLSQADHCLFDCATMWLSNHLLAGSDLAAEQTRLVNAMTACPARLVIVTNEVGHGIVPENALARQFREAQGRLNIALAASADHVVQVIAGLPQVLK
ncbi:MAG: bifunctional adenosylcobinamide kinase/adenosylcobinamide-phosphate guanylyltransferase [Pseudooceanicola sp.]|nr:bifunctional adenosylcobinamide kinase/adenosylcobinamide-phosphate guanylyltransferase [Pseudooceanicola sp.]|tara:strand:+ start:1088 stop:1597 length:510 start_codon:yes stop_codon:yes gene_type:complete